MDGENVLWWVWTRNLWCTRPVPYSWTTETWVLGWRTYYLTGLLEFKWTVKMFLSGFELTTFGAQSLHFPLEPPKHEQYAVENALLTEHFEFWNGQWKCVSVDSSSVCSVCEAQVYLLSVSLYIALHKKWRKWAKIVEILESLRKRSLWHAGLRQRR